MRLILAAALTLTAAPASALCFCLKCVTGEFQSFQPVSGSMKPALEPGACVIVYTNASSLRGQIIVFRHPTKPDIPFLFRLIGQPGDTIQITDGQVILNGTPLPQIPATAYEQSMFPEPTGNFPRCSTPTPAGETCAITRATETLPDGVTYDILDLMSDSPGDFTSEITVPPNHVFVLGDNRDNALDSRFGLAVGGLGFIPIENITGAVVEITPP